MRLFLSPDPSLTPTCGDGRAHNFVLDPTHPDLPGWWGDKLAAFHGDWIEEPVVMPSGGNRLALPTCDPAAAGAFIGRNSYHAPEPQAP